MNRNKNVIRLTESKLKQMIAEAINDVLNAEDTKEVYQVMVDNYPGSEFDRGEWVSILIKKLPIEQCHKEERLEDDDNPYYYVQYKIFNTYDEVVDWLKHQYFHELADRTGEFEQYKKLAARPHRGFKIY